MQSENNIIMDVCSHNLKLILAKKLHLTLILGKKLHNSAGPIDEMQVIC